MVRKKNVLVDEEYLRESTMTPNKQITKGFKPVMPEYEGELSEEELNQIVEILKEIK